MEAGTVGMPNGIDGPHANDGAQIAAEAAINPTDVTMIEASTLEAATEAAKAAAASNGHSAGCDLRSGKQADL